MLEFRPVASLTLVGVQGWVLWAIPALAVRSAPRGPSWLPGLRLILQATRKPAAVDGDDAIDTVLAHFAAVPSPMTLVIVEHNGDGAMDRVSASDTAFGHRDWSYKFLMTSIWADPSDDEKNIEWTREFWEAIQPFASEAVYVNYLDQEGEERVKAAYAVQTYERLVTLKNKYDPTNLFRHNQNIKPTG